MFKKDINANENYLAKFITIENIKKHPDADRLQVLSVDGNTLIVNLDYKEGDTCVYFPVESSINSELIAYANLFQDISKNKNPEQPGGFFTASCRVKPLKLRGIPTQGFLLPVPLFFDWLSSKGYTFEIPYQLPSIEFSHFNDIELLKKYQILKENQGSTKYPDGLVDGHFSLHSSTPSFYKNYKKFKLDDHIDISVKLHGTSAVFSKTLVENKLSLWQKLLKLLGANLLTRSYQFIYTSRSTFRNGHNFKYIGQDVYGVTAQKIKHHLHDGMTIYGEIVGYKPAGAFVQKHYDYGCNVNQSDFYIYRITTTTPSGLVVEWDEKRINDYAYPLGLKVVPNLYSGTVENLIKDKLTSDSDVSEVFLETIKDSFLEQSEPLCVNKVPREGVVIRKRTTSLEVYKAKSFAFLMLETAALDAGEVDMESADS